MIHEAFIYRTDDEYVSVLAPFLSQAIEEGDRALAVTSRERIDLLRDALGAEQGAVSFVDASEWYRRPGAALAAWAGELDARGAARSVRAIGEVRFGTDPVARKRWIRYESLLNRALADRAAWVVCPYDARALPDEIVESAHLTHAVVSTGAGRVPSPTHFGGPELAASLSPGSARADGRFGESVAIEAGSESIELRRAVTWAARAAGIGEEVLEDLLLAIRAVADTSARATLRVGASGGEWLCELQCASRASGALPFDENGLGVLIGRLICDRVEVVHSQAGPLVRFVFGSPKATPRDRILVAAGELFAEHGITGSGINAIIDRAGVAKATLYAHFGSKDQLVSAWLQSSPVRWFDGVRAELEARSSSPADRLTLLFDVLAEWLAANELNGCHAIGAAAEARSSEATRSMLAERDSEIEDYLRSTARAAELRDPDELASQLLVLVSGAISVATAGGSADPVAAARGAAQTLLAARR